MSHTLFVPIHLDALCLAEPQPALRAMADYRLLPNIFQNDTHASGNLNLGEQILAPLFNQEFELSAGIHLHWALPDALTNGQQDAAGTTFHQVPNRWLILRQGGNTPEKQWIVESDYLYPIDPGDDRPPPDAVTILIEPPDLATVDPADPTTYQYQRYRYMGRCWELSHWQSDRDNEYAPALTALGTQTTIPILDEVKATFAAFYPNCHSVFGFTDPDYATTAPPRGLQYDAIGWYSDAQQDCLTQFLANHGDQPAEDLLEALQTELGWTIDSELQPFPQRTLYHARITFSNSSGSATQRVNRLPEPKIAVAHSAPEALATYLSHSFYPDGDTRGQTIRNAIAEQLEALQISERLESRTLDLDARFREGRHERGFSAQNSGYLWSIIPEVSGATLFSPGAGRTQASQQESATLPLELARQLNALNVIQEEYNQAWLDIASMRRQLYSQWYYFIKHRTEDGGNFYLTINQTSLIPLRQKIAQTGELEFTGGSTGTVRTKSLGFGILSRLNDRFQRTQYFSRYYIDALQRAARGDLSTWAAIQTEFANCGLRLSDRPTVTTMTQDEAWQIVDRGQTYDVKVEGGILNLYIPPTESQIAWRLEQAIQDLLRAIAAHNNNSDRKYTLSQFPSQTYWLANDPVILFAGEAAKPPARFGRDGRLREDGLLECKPVDLDLAAILGNLAGNIRTLKGLIEQLKPPVGQEAINFITWTEQPWNPFAFHWSVLAYPSRAMANGQVLDYDDRQILDHYSLDPNATDLTLKQGAQSSFVPTANTYSGFSILTPSASLDLIDRLAKYLTDTILPEYYQDRSIPAAQQTPTYLSANVAAIRQWYEREYPRSTPEQQARDPIFVALWTYGEMQTLDCEAQAISGFNETLCLSQPTLTLEVDSPLETDPAVPIFHEQVRWTLGRSLQYRVLYGDFFNPIRSGGLSINGLWLVDSFGQHKEVISLASARNPEVVTPPPMTPPRNSLYQVLLPPRLTQPARLNFHWLAAEAQQEAEVTTEPTCTPVCGWLVPNTLDGTLGIHDAAGKALGAIDRGGRWRLPPGVSGAVAGGPQLPNVHLEKLVRYLLAQGVTFQQQFLSTLIDSLDNIDPETVADHPSLALLVGRPMAVVRATFSLEVQGLPAADPTVRLAVNQRPETRGFTGVKFPIHLGEDRQLNDGLVGYWREVPDEQADDYDDDYDDYTYEDNIFYAPQSNLVQHNLIQTDAEGITYFEQTVDAPPQRVTMLFDPRGTIHAACGILPIQELRLPPANYDEALKAIEVNFLSTPILSNQGEIAMPLSEIPGYVWSWVSLRGNSWSETETIAPINYKASFAKPQHIYEGWLQLSRAETTEDS